MGAKQKEEQGIVLDKEPVSEVSVPKPVAVAPPAEKFSVVKLARYAEQLYKQPNYVIAGVIAYHKLAPTDTLTKEEFGAKIHEFLNHKVI